LGESFCSGGDKEFEVLMIQSLHIENYAIIESVDLLFDESLNIITGETGAGKSIILGAFGLLMGQRADSKVLYNTEKKCIVEASFSDYPKSIDKLLKEGDYDIEDDLIIRREIIPSGKSRAFVNDTPANLNFLKSISVDLVDMNSQFHIPDLYSPRFQLNIIDALAGNEKLLSAYHKEYKIFKNKQSELNELQSLESTQLKELDFMNFQLNELNKAGLEAGEQQSLESQFGLLEKADEISTLMEETQFVLSESEFNLRDRLRDINNKWSTFKGVNADFDKTIDLLEVMDEQLQEIIAKAQDITDQSENDPVKLLEIRNRLDILYALLKKHGVNTAEELIDIQNNLQERVSKISNRSGAIEQLKLEIENLLSDLQFKGKKLTKSRKKVFAELEKEVAVRLNTLSMGSAEIQVSHELSELPGPNGFDDIQILFKANKGGKFQPIKKVASGGETSRLMLSLKSTVAHAMSMPTMIFDEIDTGISGDVAGKMGDILKELSNEHQLITITHSPQVASRAEKHFFVYKEDLKDRTITHVKELDKDSRTIEIAKMLSGDPPSTFALENAKELISSDTTISN